MYLPDRARYYLPLSDERVLRDRAGGRVESGRDRMLVPERLELIVFEVGTSFLPQHRWTIRGDCCETL
jgi:hypothetical protein